MCGTGDKLALCLHGSPESKFSWRAQMPLLAELGYTAWAPNLRGYGNTTRPLGIAAYGMEHLLADVAGLIDAARARGVRSEAHTSELQSIMRNSYAGFCLKKQKTSINITV